MTTRWGADAPGQYITLELRGFSIYLEDGPDEWPKRGHEGGGGTFRFQEIRDRGREWFEAYEGLYERLLDDLEPRFRVIEAAHGVFISLDDQLKPRPLPCRFVIWGDRVYVSIDAPDDQFTASTTGTLFVAEQAGSGEPGWWARIEGEPQPLDPDWEPEWTRERFAEKYPDSQRPEGEQIIRLKIQRIVAEPEDVR